MRDEDEDDYAENLAASESDYTNEPHNKYVPAGHEQETRNSGTRAYDDNNLQTASVNQRMQRYQ